VTGGATGIGREIALELGREGADLAIHFSHEREGADRAAQELREIGRKVVVIKADFNILEDPARLAGIALDQLGRVDILVNNAGITFNHAFEETTAEQLETLWNVNMRGTYLLTQQIVESMIKCGAGAICNISSIHGLQGASRHTAYAATKGAILGFTKALAMEVGYKGIRVNAIAPGWIMVESAMALPGFDISQAAARAQAKVPLGRFGVPGDVAKLAAYLCGPDALFITGQTFVVDGGTSALMSLLSDHSNKPSPTRSDSDYDNFGPI
jgi:NAD(P)-dependent dehydrogenase (short-subunit alcohol dehydrogenase family)